MRSNLFFSKLLENPSPIKFDDHFQEEPKSILHTSSETSNRQRNSTSGNSVNFKDVHQPPPKIKESSPPRIYAAKLSERLAQKTKGIQLYNIILNIIYLSN